MSAVQIRIILFLALSCALTWSGTPLNRLFSTEFWPAPMNPLGPLVAAPIVIGLTEGRAGLVRWLRRIARFRAPVSIYAAAFFIPGAIIAASFALTAATGATILPTPHYTAGELLFAVPLILISGPVPEEPAFRGYGLDTLQREIPPLAASLWIGLGVMVWHLPLLAAGEVPVTVFLPLAGVAVVYGWLYNRGGSVWPLVVLHGQLNLVSAGWTHPMMPEASDQARYLAFLGVFYLIWAAVLIWRCGPELGRSAQPPLRPLSV